MITIFYDCGGKIAKVAKRTGYTRYAIYNYLERNPVVAKECQSANRQFDDLATETAETVLHYLMQQVKIDPGNAGRSAQFILKYNRRSSYNPGNLDSGDDEIENADNLTDEIRGQCNE